jgi:hypothetical protein
MHVGAQHGGRCLFFPPNRNLKPEERRNGERIRIPGANGQALPRQPRARVQAGLTTGSVLLLVLAVDSDWLEAHAVCGGHRHTHNRRTQHNKSRCATHVLSYN